MSQNFLLVTSHFDFVLPPQVGAATFNFTRPHDQRQARHPYVRTPYSWVMSQNFLLVTCCSAPDSYFLILILIAHTCACSFRVCVRCPNSSLSAQVGGRCPRSVCLSSLFDFVQPPQGAATFNFTRPCDQRPSSALRYGASRSRTSKVRASSTRSWRWAPRP